jgi:hypothetical protein
MAAAKKAVNGVLMTVAVLSLHISISLLTSSNKFIFINFTVSAALLLLIVYLSDARALMVARYLRGR